MTVLNSTTTTTATTRSKSNIHLCIISICLYTEPSDSDQHCWEWEDGFVILSRWNKWTEDGFVILSQWKKKKRTEDGFVILSRLKKKINSRLLLLLFLYVMHNASSVLNLSGVTLSKMVRWSPCLQTVWVAVDMGVCASCHSVRKKSRQSQHYETDLDKT